MSPTMAPPASPREIFLFLLDPWLFMFQALTYLPNTMLSLLLSLQLTVLLAPARLQAAWFARFWAHAGPGVRETSEPRVLPLLEGRVRNGRVSSPHDNDDDDDGLRGVVLEVGPATGLWASVFARPSLAHAITKIYGVEPNAAHHAELRARIAAAGLGETYEVVPCGIEDLAASGRVARGSVDCIVSVLCLCSIPEQERLVRELYGYLKEGGRWFVYEHVRCESERLRDCGLGMRVYQGECSLLRPLLFYLASWLFFLTMSIACVLRAFRIEVFTVPHESVSLRLRASTIRPYEDAK